MELKPTRFRYAPEIGLALCQATKELKMQVTKTKDLGDGHKIEIGKATWDENQTSVRNRYPTSTGGFSPRSSSELPLDDVSEIVTMVAEEDLLSPSELADIISTLSASLKRQLK